MGNIHFQLVLIRSWGGIITFRKELKYDHWRILDLPAISMGYCNEINGYKRRRYHDCRVSVNVV